MACRRASVILLPLGRLQLEHACLCNLGLVTLTSCSRSSLDTPPLSYSERTTYDTRLSNLTVSILTMLLRAEQISNHICAVTSYQPPKSGGLDSEV